MKKQQKKLKASRFRYLTKEEVKNPMEHLYTFYGDETDIAYWLRTINLLVNLSVEPKMSSPFIRDNGHYIKRLIKQIEIAYVIFKKCRLPLIETPLNLFQHRRDYGNYIIEGSYTFNGEESPAHEISRFFSYKSLAEWYTCIDDIWANMIDKFNPVGEIVGDNVLVVKELLLRLAQALYDIYVEDSLPHSTKNGEPQDKTPEIANTENPEGSEEEIGDLDTPAEQEQSAEDEEEQGEEDDYFYPKDKVKLPGWLAPQRYSLGTVKNFCGMDDLTNWREVLWFWYQSVIIKELYWSEHNEKWGYSGGDLLFHYSTLYSLLEMYRSQLTENGLETRAHEESISILNQTFRSSIRYRGQIEVLFHISNQDKENPLDSILSTIVVYSKKQWDEILYEWLSFGLSKRNIDEGNYVSEASRIYQLLVRIVELTYVLAAQIEKEEATSAEITE